MKPLSFLAVLAAVWMSGASAAVDRPASIAVEQVAPPKVPASALQLPFAADDKHGLFLVLSDIHFDPFADPSLVPRLDSSSLDSWLAILQKGASTKVAGYGSDSNFALASSAIDTAASLGVKFDYVLHAGDYLSHDFPMNYQAYAGPTQQGLDQFAIKATQFVGQMMQKKLGPAPIIGAMGNNDSACGDYSIAPNSPYIAGIQRQWETLANQSDQYPNFAVGGYYKIPHPKVTNLDIIVLNDVFWASNYVDSCNSKGGDPGAAMLSWLDFQLYATQQAGRKAQILMHEPPGINAYSTARNAGTCQEKVTPFWNPNAVAGFRALILKYPGIVTQNFAGHTHMDGFTVTSDNNGSPVLATHITPSISPIFGNNPAFTVYYYERSTGNVLDSATYYLSNLNRAQSGSEPPQWRLEYIFAQAYGQNGQPILSATGLADLAQRLDANKTLRATFIRQYPASSATNPINSDNWQAFSCALKTTDISDFTTCYCAND